MFAGGSDVSITSTRIILPQVNAQGSTTSLQTSAVNMLFRLDGIALEPNETFSLGFTFLPSRFPAGTRFRDTFTGTIIDANGKNSSYKHTYKIITERYTDY